MEEIFLDSAGIEGASDWRFADKARNLKTLSITENYLNESQINLILKNIRHLTRLESLKVCSQLRDQSSIRTKVILSVDIPPQLRELDLSKTLVWPPYHKHWTMLNLFGNNRLRELGFRYNLIDEVKTPFIQFPNPNVPINIDFSYNRLFSLAFLNDSVVRGLKIKKLFLPGNSLNKYIGNNVFENFHHLETLDLSSNGIKTLIGEVFINQKKLQHLYLMGNCL